MTFFPHSARAEVTSGITVSVYSNWTEWNEYNDSPPIPPSTPLVGQFLSTRIEQNFDQYPAFGLWDDFVVKYEGYIVAPCTCTVQFSAQADDGTQLYLDDQLVTYDWWDKGGGGSTSEPISFVQGIPKHIVLWFYENGGGAWVQLWWGYNNTWEIVPDTAFILSAIPETSTTLPYLETTTTISEPVQSTTTSSTTIATTTTIVATTTTVVETTVPSTTTTVPVPLTVVEEFKNVIAQITELSDNELVTLFTTLDNADLSDEEQNAISIELSNAPADVKKTFETTVNVFNGKYDAYVPTGSNINVRQRKVLIAASGLIFVAPSVSVSSGASGTSDSRQRRRK